MKTAYIATSMALLLALAGEAAASPQIYRGQNPYITPTANSFNAPLIDAQANLSRPKNPDSARFGQLNEADLLKRSVISGLSSHYQQLLTSGDPSAAGTVNFGDGSWAQYSTANGIRTITFHNADGTTTTVEFPI